MTETKGTGYPSLNCIMAWKAEVAGLHPADSEAFMERFRAIATERELNLTGGINSATFVLDLILAFARGLDATLAIEDYGDARVLELVRDAMRPMLRMPFKLRPRVVQAAVTAHAASVGEYLTALEPTSLSLRADFIGVVAELVRIELFPNFRPKPILGRLPGDPDPGVTVMRAG